MSEKLEMSPRPTQEEMEEIKKKLSKDSAKAIVAQENMQEGDIELF